MASFWQRSGKLCIVLIVLIWTVANVSGSESLENAIPASLATVAESDVWFFNDSLKLPVESSHLNTFLVSFDNGTVQARRDSDSALWSFSSGRPLVSFQWMSNESFSEDAVDAEDTDEGVDEEGEWYVEAPDISVETDGALSVRDALNRKKTLKITLNDMRRGSVHVRRGEIIQVDRHSTLYLVDAETGAIVQEVGSGNPRDLNLEEQKKSLFLVRTDYIAKSSNLSGTMLWSLSYGEIGTLVTGLDPPSQEVAFLSLLPKMSSASPGVPSSLAEPAAIVSHPKSGAGSMGSSRTTPSGPRALPPSSSPRQSAPVARLDTKSTMSEGNRVEPQMFWPAPPMLPLPQPPPRIVTIYTAVAGLMIIAILGLVANIAVSTRVTLPPPPSRKKKGRRGSASQAEIAAAAAAAQEPRLVMNGTRIKSHAKYGNGTQVGRLFVSNVLIGSGSNGTLVMEGYLDDRKVAVKRLLAQYYEKAQKEIALLIASDEHPNVVRYYATEETTDFVYVALERCSFSLYDLILAQTSQSQSMEIEVKDDLVGKGLKMRNVEDFKLWDDGGKPSPQLFQVMRDIVAGLAHLHEICIVHRDLKPHNVLIRSGRIMQAKIADMGLSKQLDDDAVSFDTQLTGHGSSGSRGWQAPEQLLKGRGSRAMDIFSLGCVLYHCITGGKHPFGSHLERDGNIVFGKMDLFHIVDNPEATDLIERLLDPNPLKRPPAQDILLHPFFWNAEKYLAFLKDASDRVELDIKEQKPVLLADLESLEPAVLSGAWDAKLDLALLQNIRGYRRYSFRSVRDLLRVIRNKAGHFGELPEHLQTLLGPVPDGLQEYFRSRFPRLLIEIYQVIGYHCSKEPSLEKYYPPSYVPKFTPT